MKNVKITAEEFEALGGELSWNLPGKQDILPEGVIEIRNKESYQFQVGFMSHTTTNPTLVVSMEDDYFENEYVEMLAKKRYERP